MSKKNRRLMVLFIVVIIGSISAMFYIQHNQYKKYIGSYDYFTLHQIEYEFGNIVELYNRNELDEETYEEFIDVLQITAQYTMRSPLLTYMVHPLVEFSLQPYEELSEEDIEWMQAIHTEFRRIVIEESRVPGYDDIGIPIYNYLADSDNKAFLEALINSNPKL